MSHKKLFFVRKFILFLSALAVVFFIFNSFLFAGAAEQKTTKPEDYKTAPFKFQVPIPDLRGGIIVLSQPQKIIEGGKLKYLSIPWIAEYIKGLYNFSVSILGILAVVMVMWGGLQYVAAGGNSRLISAAKSQISHALIGLLLALFSWTFLSLINPNLVKLKSIEVGVAERAELDRAKAQYFSNAKLLAAKDYPPGFNDVPLYKQCDSRWGNNSYPAFEDGKKKDCPSICYAACGPVSLAMTVNFHLKKQGKEIRPEDLIVQVIDYANSLSERPTCDGGTNAIIFTDAKLKEKWNLRGEEVSLSAAMDILKNKKEPIIFLVSRCTDPNSGFYCKSGGGTDYSKAFQKLYAGHYMVLTGVDENGNIRINDPYMAIESGVGATTEEELEQHAVGYWYVHP